LEFKELVFVGVVERWAFDYGGGVEA